MPLFGPFFVVLGGGCVGSSFTWHRFLGIPPPLSMGDSITVFRPGRARTGDSNSKLEGTLVLSAPTSSSGPPPVDRSWVKGKGWIEINGTKSILIESFYVLGWHKGAPYMALIDTECIN